MPGEHDHLSGEKFLAMYTGTVTDNKDPERVGRLKVKIPGVCEPSSGWAFPLGPVGGGANRRGFYDPPDVGAEVAVFFRAGDVDDPYYLAGNWGVVAGKAETPGPVGGYASPNKDGSPGTPEEVSPEDAPKVKAYETDRYILIMDDRANKARMLWEDKKTGDHVLLDGVNNLVEIHGTALVHITSDAMVSIDAPQVQINKRLIPLGTKPLGV